MYKLDIQNLSGSRSDIISIWNTWSNMHTNIIKFWPSEDLYHLRNRVGICLFGMLNKLSVIPKSSVSPFNISSDITEFNKLSWPATMAECFIVSNDHYNVFMDLEHMFSITWIA